MSQSDTQTTDRWPLMRVRPLTDFVAGVRVGGGEYIMTGPEMVVLRDMLDAGIERLRGKAGGEPGR